LLKGGKYCRIWTQNPMGDKFYNWISNCEVRLLTEDYEDFANPVEDENFLKKTGQDQYHRYRDQFDFNRRESDLSIQSRQTLDGASEASWHIKAKEEIMEKLGVS